MGKNAKLSKRQKELQRQGILDAEGYYTLPKVPAGSGINSELHPHGMPQNMVDVVKEQNRGRNQVLDRTSRRPSERTMYGDRIGEEEVRNPFKNGYFKPTRDQSASKNVNLAQAREDVKNLQKSQAAGTDERTNAQKLFNSISGNETHSDSQGNRVAYKDGRPVGFSGKPDKNGKVMGQGHVKDSRKILVNGKPISPGNASNTKGNFTQNERGQIRDQIQNVAQRFEQGKFELPKVQPKSTPSIPSVPVPSQTTPEQSQSIDQLVATLPDMSDGSEKVNPSSGFSLPQISDPLGLTQQPSSGVEHLRDESPQAKAYAMEQARQAAAKEFAAKYPQLANPVNPVATPPVQSAPPQIMPEVPSSTPPTPPYVDDFNNGAPTVPPIVQNPDPEFWMQFLGRPVATPYARPKAPVHQGRYPRPAHPASPTGQLQNSPEFKARQAAEQAQLMAGLPVHRQPKLQ